MNVRSRVPSKHDGCTGVYCVFAPGGRRASSSIGSNIRAARSGAVASRWSNTVIDDTSRLAPPSRDAPRQSRPTTSAASQWKRIDLLVR